jgi:hypothetical protein
MDNKYYLEIEAGGGAIVLMYGEKEIACGITAKIEGWKPKVVTRKNTLALIVDRLNGLKNKLPGKYYKITGNDPIKLYEYGEYAGGIEGIDNLLQEVCEIKDKESAELMMGAVSSNANSSAVSLGRKGGAVKSEKKAATSRENGRKGGRPKKEK